MRLIKVLDVRLVVALLALVAVIHSEQQSAPDAQASAIATTIGDLRKYGQQGASVPAEVQPLLTRLKSEIRALVLNELSKAPRDTALDLKAIRQSVITHLSNVNVIVGQVPAVQNGGAAGGAPGTAPPAYLRPDFGHIEELSLTVAARNPAVVRLLVRLGIPCGSDTSLTGLIKTNDSWTASFILERNNYPTIIQALGNLVYDISPPDENGVFTVVSTNAALSCQEQSSILELSAISVDPGRGKVLELFDANNPERLQKNVVTPKTDILAGFNDFEIKLRVGKFLNRAQPDRLRTLRFEVIDATLLQTAPSMKTTNITDFIDDWASLPWPIAQKWVKGVAVSLIECRHSIINVAGLSASPPSVIGLPQRCGEKSFLAVEIPSKGIFFITVNDVNGLASILNVNTTNPCS